MFCLDWSKCHGARLPTQGGTWHKEENLPASPSNGTEADPSWCPSEAVPMGQMPLTTRFGNNQAITQRTLWVPRCPNGAHSTQCWTGKPPLLTGLWFLPKAMEPVNNKGTGQEQVQSAGTQWDKIVPELWTGWPKTQCSGLIQGKSLQLLLPWLFLTIQIVALRGPPSQVLRNPRANTIRAIRTGKFRSLFHHFWKP